jgi:glycosyltransferase involved in cell wall biosynthesis
VDTIVVNSRWSREALVQEGVPESKIVIIPLAYECSTEARSFSRSYPEAFTATRPLRVLFLGQIDLRKGLYPLLEAINLLRREPVEFWFAGPHRIKVPPEFKCDKAIQWLGNVPRKNVSELYRNADVFIFPTFSDGFGLTQLEAQAWKLPIVVSRFCGDVVQDGVNGVLLREITATEIAKTLLDLLRNPARLREMTANSRVEEKFTVDAVGSALLDLSNDRN